MPSSLKRSFYFLIIVSKAIINIAIIRHSADSVSVFMGETARDRDNEKETEYMREREREVRERERVKSEEEIEKTE